MSAAEKLERLDEALRDGPWRATNGWVQPQDGAAIFKHPHSGAGPQNVVDAESVALLRNALPLIVAVVEAAEGVKLAEFNGGGDFSPLMAALAALDEALT